MDDFGKEICDFYRWRRENGTLVLVNKFLLEALAAEIKNGKTEIPGWFMPLILPQRSRAFVSHLFYISAQNFAFTHFKQPYEKYRLDGKTTGSFAASAAFYRHFGENEIFAGAITKITSSRKKMADFYRGENLPPLLEKRRKNLAVAAEVLYKKFWDDVMALLSSVDFCSRRLTLKLISPGIFGNVFQDVSLFNSPDKKWILFFNKRANLFSLMYQGRALSSGGELPLLRDPEKIGPVIDYQIPRILRDKGVLVYNSRLAEKVDNRKLIKFRSPEEIDIRSAAFYAVSEIQRLTGLSMMEIDYYLWSLGRSLGGNISMPHHLTKTAAY